MTKTIIFILLVVILLFLLIVFTGLMIWYHIKRKLRSLGLDDDIKNLSETMHTLKLEDSKRARSASGMTKVLLPTIRRDFPEFNENRLYNMTEESLRVIFRALTEKRTDELTKVPLLKDNITMMLDDMKRSDIAHIYRDIVFHDFAIKDYHRADGVATITVSVSLEYYYRKTKNEAILIDDKYKRQTRYACEFIYVYNESLVKDYEKVLATNCPNCGAVIKSLGHKYCEYCGTAIKEVNLKAWAFSSYKEY